MKVNIRRLLLALVIIAGGFLSLLSFHLVKNLRLSNAAIAFEQQAADRLYSIESAINAEQMFVFSVTRFFLSSVHVDRGEFAQFVSPAFDRHAIQALEWIPRVAASERRRYEEAAVQDGLQGFRFTERSPAGDVVPVQPRAEYFPVFYLEPLQGNEAALGFDLGSHPGRRAALERAMITGKAAASESIDLVQGGKGVLLFDPIYKSDMPVDTVEQRRRNLTGFSLGVFKIAKMIEAPYSRERLKRPVGIDVYLFEEIGQTRSEPIYVHHSRARKGGVAPNLTLQEAQSGTHLNSSFDFGGITWTLIARPIASDFGFGTPWSAWGALSLGILLTLLFAAYLVAVISRSQAIEREVANRTIDLRASEARVRAIVDTAYDGIVTIDESGVVETFNSAAERIFKYKADEIVGKNVKMLMPEPYHSEHDGYLGNYLSTGEAKVIGIGREVTGLRKSGETFPMDLAVNEMQVAGQRMFTGIVRDITERKLVDQMKAEFLATVSHELRTPLASIVGFTDLILDGDAGKVAPEAEEFLRIISSNALRLNDLINHLLDIEKIESGKTELEKKPLKIEEVLSSVHDTFKVSAEQKGLGLEFSLEKELQVRGDVNRLTQVFSNLVSNAVKYTKTGSVRVTAKKQDQEIVVRVTDTGIGVSEADMEKLFEKFFRASDEFTRSAGGTGLGLTITKAIVGEHGGEITVRSELGKGSEFEVRLPRLNVKTLETRERGRNGKQASPDRDGAAHRG